MEGVSKGVSFLANPLKYHHFYFLIHPADKGGLRPLRLQIPWGVTRKGWINKLSYGSIRMSVGMMNCWSNMSTWLTRFSNLSAAQGNWWRTSCTASAWWTNQVRKNTMLLLGFKFRVPLYDDRYQEHERKRQERALAAAQVSTARNAHVGMGG